MKKSVLKTAIVAAMGVTAVAATSVASAGVMSANWTGYFIMLDPAGNALANTSIAKTSNQMVTQVSGTMQFDDVTGAGTATLVPFQFFSGDPTLGFLSVPVELAILCVLAVLFITGAYFALAKLEHVRGKLDVTMPQALEHIGERAQPSVNSDLE